MADFSKKMYILGHPVAHSKSPEFWNGYFTENHIDMAYDFMDISDELSAREFIESRQFRAINITTPYKKLAYSCADTLDGAAKFAGGVNFLINNDGTLEGYNVDGIGCVRALQSYGLELVNNTVIVCGTGPTAKSIAYALTEAGSVILMLTRSVDKADIPPHHDMNLGVLEYERAAHDIEYANIIINATTLGMKTSDPSPIDYNLLSSGQFVYDCIYGHGETQIIKDAKSVGCKSFAGDRMLVEQAKSCRDILFK